MLADVGCRYVIVGHSERRADHGETDSLVQAKAEAALAAGLVPMVCLGETEAERDRGECLTVVARQLAGSLPDRAAATGDQSSAPTHLGDVDSEGLDAEIELMHNEEDMIKSIDEAIKRTENGTFGECEDCGKEIAEARLEAIPYAPLCIECARREEAEAQSS